VPHSPAALACDGAASIGPSPPAAVSAHTSRAAARATSMGALQVSSSLMVSMPRTTIPTYGRPQERQQQQYFVSNKQQNQRQEQQNAVAWTRPEGSPVRARVQRGRDALGALGSEGPLPINGWCGWFSARATATAAHLSCFEHTVAHDTIPSNQ
jgi:hypothetical protein